MVKVPFPTLAPLPDHTPSVYQQAFYDWVVHGSGNALLVAVAGSGKSSTIKRAVRLVIGACLFLAFNRAIADELKKAGVNARTFHSLCWTPVLRSRGLKDVDKDKVGKLLEGLVSDDEMPYRSWLKRMLSIGRNAGIGCLIDDTPENWAALSEKYEIELDDERTSYVRGYALCSQALEACYHAPTVDFDDLLYLAVRDGVALPKFDWVFLDEAQDTNPIQRAILRKLFRPTTRFAAVGDPAQAIYGFRGADSDSLNLIKEEFRCIELPLSISYRCATAIVEHARQWVAHIEPAPTAPQGSVTSLGTKWSTDLFKASDLIVCRANAPLLSLAYTMLRAHRPVYVMGKEIGDGLKALIRKMRARDVDHLQQKLEAWATRESEKAVAKRDEEKAEKIRDKAAALLVLIESLPENRRTVDELYAVIDSIFREKAAATILASIHKSKGLEADRVFWLNSSRMPSPYARQDWQKQQECNLCYVATTRAKTELYLIEQEQKR